MTFDGVFHLTFFIASSATHLQWFGRINAITKVQHLTLILQLTLELRRI
jgi:hypothetical protein